MKSRVARSMGYMRWMLIGVLVLAPVYVPLLMLFSRLEGAAGLLGPGRSVGRALLRAWGPFAGCWLLVSLLFFGLSWDSQRFTTRIAVEPGFPAIAAGVRDGDRIVEVNGAPVEAFSDIAKARQPGGPQRLLIERGGERLTVDVLPDEKGRLGLKVGESRPLSLGEKVSAGLTGPFTTLWFMARVVGRLVLGHGELSESGQPAMVASPGGAPWMSFGAVAAAQSLPLMFIVSAVVMVVALVRRPRREG